MYNEIITYYSKNPPNKWKLEKYDIEYTTESRSCWDNIYVYIKIDNEKIIDWSFEWDTSIITTACASIYWESIIWLSLEEVLSKGYEYIKEIVEMDISSRRREASVLGLLVTRNAIHKYLKDGKKDTFDDVIK